MCELYENMLNEILSKQYDICKDKWNCLDCIFENECDKVFVSDRPDSICDKETFIKKIKEEMLRGCE
ncbi:hypothetical protein [Clostridium perfringens]|uniref:Uncharacterized protein n=2 Tax=Clostridium perfringens TaxID=1502 RepID=A0AAP6WMP3_CLOPF|nr:hypothetical protein [Clostridium perfringens]NP_612865.1 Gp36 protein [Clostridium phage phi3626]AAL96806.1 Gp36 protein [Clostridium phage phi3626]EDT22875.1 conserved domain protein [Clostridium perfringens B str. ATCC 3626]NGU30628.1 hypothetical protein [Clostridium perfringens]WEV05041.1 hypothetical protein PL322_13815 [Clostridium perfringens B]